MSYFGGLVLGWTLSAALMLTGCTGDSDNANQTNGPPIEVHCAAASPTGATTVRVQCPPP